MILLLVVTSFGTNVRAQEVSIPDSGLDAAIRATLVKPAGPLTVQDMLSLTNLTAESRGVKSLQGLGTARNLTALDLFNNQLRSLTLPAELNGLTTLNLAENPVQSLSLPAGFTNLTTLYLRAVIH
jgi:Leucine-rich repeat (LRR) protein